MVELFAGGRLCSHWGMQGSHDRDSRSIVSTAPGAVASDGAAIAFGHPVPDGLELVWKSGERSMFHWIWLRDNCPEGRTWIDGIWTRVRRVVDLPARPQAKGFRIERDGLRVQWTHTLLESYFP